VTILAEAASDELHNQAMFVQFDIAFEILPGTRLAWMSMTRKWNFFRIVRGNCFASRSV
jgi:hypothetical protein